MSNATTATARFGGTRRIRQRALASLAPMLALAGAAAALAPGQARAQNHDPSTGWMRFASQGSGGEVGAPPDRSFTKEWEANPPKGFPTLSAQNIGPMNAAIKRYATIVEQGGWPMLPDGPQLQSGMSHPTVAQLRQRLLMSGDLKEAGGGERFDYYLEKAVKRYQASNGLTPTGIVDKRTLAALNVPAATRLKQLKTNLSRLNELARSAGKRYVVVNIPAAQIEAVENDRVVSRHSGVVGKIDRPTPLLHTAIHEMNFNPVWTLPPTVIEKDLIPKGQDMERKGQNVLSKFHIDAYDASGRKVDPTQVRWASGAAHNLSFRQQPGKENPLGFLKINFHNAYSVYMHDTPSDSLFGRNFRAASSGCVRVQGIEHLAQWLLAENGGWSEDRVQQLKLSGERLDVKLKRPVPLHFVYLTAWATEDGVVQFRRDLYQKDGVGPIAAAY